MIARGSSRNRFSRPTLMLRTIPARVRTPRCLVIAWRDNRLPAVSRAIDCDSPADSRASTESLVRSPSAAKIEARRFRAWSCRTVDMTRDVLHLLLPAALVHPEGFGATMRRYLVEARLDDTDPCAGSDLLQGELDESRRFAGVVDSGIDGIGVPGEGEEPHRLDLLDHRLH